METFRFNDIIAYTIEYDARVMHYGKPLITNINQIKQCNRILARPESEIDEMFGYGDTLLFKNVEIGPTYDGKIRFYSDGHFTNVCITHTWYVLNIGKNYKICKALLDKINYDWICNIEYVDEIFGDIHLGVANKSIESIEKYRDQDCYDLDDIACNIIRARYKKYITDKRRKYIGGALNMPNVLVDLVVGYL